MPTSLSISDRQHAKVLTILVLAYLAGIIGLQVPHLATYFRPLSPITLVASLAVLLAYHTDWKPAFYVYIFLAIATGYFIEVLGVQTGLIFGQYAYGSGLGFKLWSVPPVIGINWLTLSYCCGSLCNRLRIPTFLKVVLAATLMVGLDFFIEPVAVQLDFWTWFGQPVPLRNYVGWWLVSFALLSIWFVLPFRKDNRMAGWLLLLQFFFFLFHGLIFRLNG